MTPEFILGAILDYKNSMAYKTAVEAQEYYAAKNRTILRRMTYLEKYGLINSKVKFHKIMNGFFPKAVKQISQYLLGNGVTLPQEQKRLLGPRFDYSLQKIGRQALVDGVNWGYWVRGETRDGKTGPNKLRIFRATEFAPLLDERTSDLRAGIRFWQMADDRPLYIELFDERGITQFKASDGEVKQTSTKPTPYFRPVAVDASGEHEVADSVNNPTIPIVPFYANELKESEFNPTIKGLIDADDFVMSDLADGATLTEGLYWLIKNFGGEDAAELVTEVQELKATFTDAGAEAEISPEVVEIPHEAKTKFHDLATRALYNSFMALDIDTIAGGSLTNVAINTSKYDVDLKCDLLEYEAIEFVCRSLEILGDTSGEEPQFKRRSITNDSESINDVANVVDILETATYDTLIEWAAKKIPIITDDEEADIVKKLLDERQTKANQQYDYVELDNEGGEESDGQPPRAEE